MLAALGGGGGGLGGFSKAGFVRAPGLLSQFP